MNTAQQVDDDSEEWIISPHESEPEEDYTADHGDSVWPSDTFYSTTKYHKRQPRILTCIGCGKEFEKKPKYRSEYCSHLCSLTTRHIGRELKTQQPRNPTFGMATCKTCGAVFDWACTRCGEKHGATTDGLRCAYCVEHKHMLAKAARLEMIQDDEEDIARPDVIDIDVSSECTAYTTSTILHAR